MGLRAWVSSSPGPDWTCRRRSRVAPAAPLRWRNTAEELAAGLRRKPGVQLFWPTGPRLPVVSFVHRDFDPAEVGSMLDAAGIHVRSGFHCAPWIHAALGTATAGTVRMSPGPDVSADDIRQALAAVAD